MNKDDIIAAVKEGLKPEFDRLDKRITDVATSLDEQITGGETRLETKIGTVEKGLRQAIKTAAQRLTEKIEQEIKGQDKLFETILTNVIRYELGKHKEELKNELKPTIDKVERHEKAFELLTTAVAAE